MCTTTDMENYFSSSYSITIVVLLLCLLTIHTYPIYVHISSTIDMEEDRHAVASLLWSQYPHTIRGRRRWKWLFYALCQTNEFVFREMTTISIWSFSKEAAASFHSLNFSSSLYSRDKPQQQQQQPTWSLHMKVTCSINLNAKGSEWGHRRKPSKAYQSWKSCLLGSYEI